MKELFTALIAARKEMPDPRKSGKNPAFRSTFVPRDEALDAIVPTALQFGLLVSQAPVSDDHGYGVHTTLIHESGQSLDCGVFTVKPAKDDPQGAVAATTYASRCALMLVFSIAGDDDDDGNGVSKPANTPVKRENAPQSTQTHKVASAPAKPTKAHSDALNRVAALGKRVMESGVSGEQLAAFVVKEKGKPTSELSEDELVSLERLMRVSYAKQLSDGA